MEYIRIGGKDHGKTFLSVILEDRKLTMRARHMTVEKENTEYIKD